MSILVCPFDGTSRYSSSALGADLIMRQIFRVLDKLECKRVALESRNSSLYCHHLKEISSAKYYKLAIGGEHLITLPLLESWRERYPSMRVVVLDAHHDAYPFPLSTHYTVFHYAIKELQIPVLHLGLRYEIERASTKLAYINGVEINNSSDDILLERIMTFISGDPFYLSVDLDVLDPNEFCAVSAPTPNGLTIQKLVTILNNLFQLKPIAADIVEYNPNCDSPAHSELLKLSPVTDVIKRWYCNGVL